MEPNFTELTGNNCSLTSLLVMDRYETKFYRSHGQQLQYSLPCGRWTCTERNFTDFRGNSCLLTSLLVLDLYKTKFSDGQHLLLSSLLALDLYGTKFYRAHRQQLLTDLPARYGPVRNEILQISRATAAVLTPLRALDLYGTKFYKFQGQQLLTNLLARFGHVQRKIFTDLTGNMCYSPPCWLWTCTEPNFGTARSLGHTSADTGRSLEQSPSRLLALPQGVRSGSHHRPY